MSLRRWILVLLLTLGVTSKATAAAGMAFDPVGNLYLLGANPSTIFKFSPDGAVRKFATSTGPGEDWNGIAIDGQGNVFVATDATARNGAVIARILKFTPAGKKSVYVANLGKGQPKTLAFDHNGNLFVGIFAAGKWRSSDTIYKITPNAQQSVFSTAVEDPTFFALDHTGNLFVYDESRKISKLAPNGSEITSMKTGDVYDLVCDAADNLIVALPHDKKIEKVAPDGTKTTIATDTEPWFLAIDKAGTIFALDDGIVKFSPDGKRTLFAPNPIN